jgi:hypothetical protein
MRERRRQDLRLAYLPWPGSQRAMVLSGSPSVSSISFALLHWFRRLRIRWEIRDDIHEAFLGLACGIICWRRLANLSLC